MSTNLEGKTAVVVGAGRGFGRGVAEALSAAGADVLAIARHPAQHEDPRISALTADAADPVVAGEVLDEHDPDILAVVAGVAPLLRPIHQHTWETFSRTWEVDVRLAFNWLREALLKPLRPGSRVLLTSSGAALQGSPLSGGYAGAKATIRFMAAYADDESRRRELGIRVAAVLPKLTPTTRLGHAAVAAYAKRRGISEEEYAASLGATLTPEQAGEAFLALATGELDGAVAFTLTGDRGLVAL
jgi:NAD(P)-dependent dehydrogenase (short-subunit alcohol dehydrogenase family)